MTKTIEHAHEVSEMLAEPTMIGAGTAVLEITAQSSDEALQLLADVESIDSPIRAIVSVNKLREGWDVKNIAVIVALRTLASQRLTEQILGRGLRLPFGSRTGMPDVDQVDLVAHDSYTQLLAQKDVLARRLHTTSASRPTGESGEAPTVLTDDEREAAASNLPTSTAPEIKAPGERAPVGGAPEELENDMGDFLRFDDTDSRANSGTPKPRSRVEGSPKVVFPRIERRLRHSEFSLSAVADQQARIEGARFDRESASVLSREALMGRREGDEVVIDQVEVDSVRAAQTMVTMDLVREQLIEKILKMREVPRMRHSRTAAERIVDAFVRGAGGSTDSWGEKRLDLAAEGLRRMIERSIKDRPHEESFAFEPVRIPVEPQYFDEATAVSHTRAVFRKGQLYSGWERSVMPYASFDAGTTEWLLAKMLERARDFRWWLRLERGGDVYLQTEAGRYYPDFIAIDSDDTHWLIEGKSDHDARYDETVQLKRDTAVQWARVVRDQGDFGQWRYLFAQERDIKASEGLWENLLVITDPE